MYWGEMSSSVVGLSARIGAEPGERSMSRRNRRNGDLVGCVRCWQTACLPGSELGGHGSSTPTIYGRWSIAGPKLAARGAPLRPGRCWRWPMVRTQVCRRLNGHGLGNVWPRVWTQSSVACLPGQGSGGSHPSVLDRLAEAPAVVRGGISAAAEHGADLMAVDGFEGYRCVTRVPATRRKRRESPERQRSESA